MTRKQIKQAIGAAAWLTIALTGAFKGFLFFAELVNTVFAALLAVVLVAALLPLLSSGRSWSTRLARAGAHVLNVVLFTALFASGVSAKFDTAAATTEQHDAARIAAEKRIAASELRVQALDLTTSKQGLSARARADRKARELDKQAEQTDTLTAHPADSDGIGRNLGFILKLGSGKADYVWYVIGIAALFALLLDITAGHACSWVHPPKPAKTPDNTGREPDVISDEPGQLSETAQTAPEQSRTPVQGVLKLVETAAVAGAEKLAELKFNQEQQKQTKRYENKPVFFDSAKFMARVTPEQVRVLLPVDLLPADPVKADEFVGAIVYVCRAAYAPRQSLKIAAVLQAVAEHHAAAAKLVTKHALTTKVIPALTDGLHFAKVGKDAQGRNVWEWAGKAEIELAVRKLHIEEEAA